MADEPAREGGAVNPHQSFGGPGDRVFVSRANASTYPRTRQAGDLFQPVTSSEPPAAAMTDQPDEVVVVPAPQSGSASAARRWAGLRAGLVAGTPGAVIALVASAALVLVVAGMTMSTRSSSTESAVAGPAPGRLPAPALPAVSNDQLVTASPAGASAGSAPQAPAEVSSPAAPPAHQQPSPPATRAVQAQPASVRTPDRGPVLPPPSSPPPSTVTTEDAGYWTVTSGSHAVKPAPAPGTGPCNCDLSRRQIDNYRDRPSQVDRQRERRAERARYRSVSRTQQSGVSEKEEQHRSAARPDAEAGRRSSLN